MSQILHNKHFIFHLITITNCYIMLVKQYIVVCVDFFVTYPEHEYL